MLLVFPYASKSKLLYDWWLVSQYVLMSSTLAGLATRYYFLSECCCLKFAALFLWAALSDKRTGLQSKSKLLTTDSQSVSQSVCLGIKHPCGTWDQILFPVGMLLSEICGLVSMGRPLSREDGSAICGVIAQWSESLRSQSHTLLSHLRLPQPGGPGSHIYIPPGTVWPSYTPRHWVPFT
jgi:hypothetical protein